MSDTTAPDLDADLPSSDMEDLGTVDVAVIVFDSGELDPDVAPAIVDLHRSGTVRVLDLAYVRRSDEGTTVVEVDESDVAEAFSAIDPADELDLLSDSDLDDVGDALEPGAGALVVVWENSWAKRLAARVRRSQGRVHSLVRVPVEDVATAVAAAREEI